MIKNWRLRRIDRQLAGLNARYAAQLVLCKTGAVYSAAFVRGVVDSAQKIAQLEILRIQIERG